jgi:hypothetical protein
VTEKPAQKNRLAVRPYEDRPVGSLQEPDLAAMTKEERDARRATVGRLGDLFKKAEKRDEKAVPPTLGNARPPDTIVMHDITGYRPRRPYEVVSGRSHRSNPESSVFSFSSKTGVSSISP